MRTRRYRSRSEGDSLALEVSFTGAVEIGEDNPRRTDVAVDAWERIEQAPAGWAELWSLRPGNLEMPSGPWHGFCLTAVVGGRLFAALGHELMRLEVRGGDAVWRRVTGNTPIRQILPASEGKLLVVRHEGYGFDAGEDRSNICALGADGDLRWYAQLPHPDDSFTNWVRPDGDELVTTTWDGFECRLAAADGSIVEKHWSR